MNEQKSAPVRRKKRSQLAEIWRRMRRNRLAMLGLAVVVILILVAVFADQIADYDTVVIKQDVVHRFQGPSAKHWFGTDELGRDIFARLVHGARISLLVGVVAVAIALATGGTLGAIAGYFGGKVDSIIMRGLDIFMSVPDILFTMAVVFALGANTVNLVIALTLAYFTNYVRLVRSQILSLSDLEYVEAAKAGGASSARIILTHIFPNAMGVIIVNTTLNVAKIILYESTLGFLGLGMPPPAPEWGQIISDAREYMRVAPHMLVFPALAIVITACSVNLVGDGLRDAMDPHLKS